MTDPNLPPPERVVHQTTINTQPAPGRKGGGGGWLAFLVGGLVVAVAVIGWFRYSGGRPPAAPEPPEVNINLPTPRLPDAPRLPDRPKLPDVPRPAEPPTVAAPAREPAG